MPAVFQAHLGSLSQPMQTLSDQINGHDSAQRVFSLDQPELQVPPSLSRRTKKLLSTRSRGVPPQYANAWHWAGEWVKTHGVTLPPDTSEYRSLRNWFCYQVNMHKNNKLSPRSRELLAKHGIDLSLYRAPKTGRGQLLDDKALVMQLRHHHKITGSYDLTEQAEEELLMWQRRLLQAYLSRGTSERMQAIAAQLPGFRYGLWMRPDDKPVPRSQMGWWYRAADFRSATRECPAFRGRVDPRTPVYLASWAREQIEAAGRKQLSSRQRGELISLGLLPSGEVHRSKEREVALAQARESLMTPASAQPHFGRRERNLKTFLGTTLLARLLQRNAPLRDIYSSLLISPMQFERVRTAIAMITVALVSLASRHALRDVRGAYQLHSTAFDAAASADDLAEDVFEHLPAAQADRARRLAAVLLEVREQMRVINVRQGLPAAAQLQSH